jgi:hypothetical protein
MDCSEEERADPGLPGRRKQKNHSVKMKKIEGSHLAPLFFRSQWIPESVNVIAAIKETAPAKELPELNCRIAESRNNPAATK